MHKESCCAARLGRSRAYTLVEVLVALAILGVLLGLLTPVLSSVREVSRKAACQNHVRQLALAVISHETHHGHYPTGGWTYAWVGDPDRGYREEQPGGWIYNVLGYLEEHELRQLGNGRRDDKPKALAVLTGTALAVSSCPSRNPGGSLSMYKALRPPWNADHVPIVAKSDYAINAGDEDFGGLGAGPATLKEGARQPWPDASSATGISHQRSTVRANQVRDGTSRTYCLGEKHVSPSGLDIGYDQSMYTGYDYDLFRWSDHQLEKDGEGTVRSFGSAHAAGCNFAFLDGSVSFLAYEIHRDVHRRFGNRQDGDQAIEQR